MGGTGWWGKARSAVWDTWSLRCCQIASRDTEEVRSWMCESEVQERKPC